MMRVTCPHCGKIYKLKREKISRRKKIVFPCPACNGSIRLCFVETCKQKETPTVVHKHQQKGPRTSASPRRHAKTQPSGIELKYGILRSMGDLPAMPHIVSKAQAVMSDPKGSLKTLANIIAVEPAIATNVMKLANSSYFGMSGKVETIQRAMVLIGEKALGELITMAGISNIMNQELNGYKLASGDLWKHSIAVAAASEIIAKKIAPELDKTVFFAGLIHDAGKIILDRYVYERREIFEDFMRNSNADFLEAEKHILGFNHSDLAAEFCKKWNIPQDQTIAIQFHHAPSRSKGHPMAYILHVANAIAKVSVDDKAGGDSSHLDGIESDTMEFLGLEQECIEEIIENVVERVDKIFVDMQSPGT